MRPLLSAIASMDAEVENINEMELHRRTWDNAGHPLYEALKKSGQSTRIVKEKDDRAERELERLTKEIRKLSREMSRL